MSLCIFSPWLPSSNSVPCNKTVYFVSFLHEEAIISRTVYTVVQGAIYACLCTSFKSAICLIMYPNDRLHSAGATTISLDSFRGLGPSCVPVRGILCLTPHHVFSMRWVCAPVFGSTKFRLWFRLSTCRSWTRQSQQSYLVRLFAPGTNKCNACFRAACNMH